MGWNFIRRKAKVVCCKDDDRRGTVSEREIRFPGLHVSAAEIEESKGKFFINFSPASFRQGGESDSGLGVRFPSAWERKFVFLGCTIRKKRSILRNRGQDVKQIIAVSNRLKAMIAYLFKWAAQPEQARRIDGWDLKVSPEMSRPEG